MGFDSTPASPGVPGGAAASDGAEPETTDATLEPAAPEPAAPEPAATDAAPHPGAAPHPAAAPESGVAPEPGAEPETVEAVPELDAEPGDEPVLDVAALAEKAEKADEYLALAQRTQADFENYRKRALRDNAVAQERGIAKLAKELLPAVDNLDRALSAAQDAAAAAGEGDEVHGQLVSGIQLVHADVISALQRAGIEGFSPVGETFDPQWHEAVAQAPIPGADSGSVVEVYQRGYRLGESVLRPARVLVAA